MTHIEAMKLALERAERKLSAYVGVCTGDKELTDAVLPMVHQAIADAEKQEQGEPVAIYMGHRLTPEGTKEFWGLADKPLPEGTKLYTHPQPAQPKSEQDPVAFTITGKMGNIYSFTGDYDLRKGDKVYTHPQPKREPLTFQDVAHLWMHTNDYYKFARAIEAAHGIKE